MKRVLLKGSQVVLFFAMMIAYALLVAFISTGYTKQAAVSAVLVTLFIKLFKNVCIHTIGQCRSFVSKQTQTDKWRGIRYLTMSRMSRRCTAAIEDSESTVFIWMTVGIILGVISRSIPYLDFVGVVCAIPALFKFRGVCSRYVHYAKEMIK